MRRFVALFFAVGALLTLTLAGGPDGDRDGVPDDQDCRPVDSSLWAPPALGVADLTLDRIGDDAALEWTRPADLGGIAGSERYDVFAAWTATNFGHPGGYCVELESTKVSALDNRLIHPGECLYYLVRVENECGTAPVDSDPPPAIPRELHYVVATNTDAMGPGSLRGTILAADDGDAICVDATGVIDISDDLILDKNLSIDGRDAALLTLQAGAIRVQSDSFYLSRMTVDGTGGGSLSGVSLGGATGTLASMTISSHNDGISSGLPTIRDSLIQHNFTGVRAAANLYNTRVMDNSIGLVWGGNGVSIVASEFSGNGYGIQSWFSDSLKTIVSSTISDNDIGVHVYYSYGLTIESSTIANNDVGAWVNLDSNLRIRSGTIVGNTLGIDGFNSYYEFADLRNTALDNATNCDSNSLLTSSGHNIVNGGSCWTLKQTDQLADPLLGPLQDNGGPTLTAAPLPGSPAIDAGSCPDRTRDQRGFPRPVDDPAVPNVDDACDVGSVEGP